MNYYERIQRSIDFIESNLENDIKIEDAARQAFMASSSYYRMFFALTGRGVKEYIRNRRISKAAREIKTGGSILDIALKYGFASHESFTRAFRRAVGVTPSAFKRSDKQYSFERVSVLDMYYDIQDGELLEKYPDIKVLKKLEPVRVAYYCYCGFEPERNAFKVMSAWLKKSGLSFRKDRLRVFGFNNPSPQSPEQTEYGYEIWVTIGDSVDVEDGLIKTKTFDGGLYAVCGVRELKTSISGAGDGHEIMETWQRFSKWLEESKYTLGSHQWLEEHLQFSDAFEYTGGMDLYMPIKI
jgi:AraC family transcriptional regulator